MYNAKRTDTYFRGELNKFIQVAESQLLTPHMIVSFLYKRLLHVNHQLIFCHKGNISNH
jgi:hypothetical protein